jgi:hypothetical protein
MKDGNKGHLSMSLTDGTYLSHWPNQPAGPFKKYPGAQLSFQSDVISEGCQPDEILKLPNNMVDENKIKTWWMQSIKEGTTYNLLFSNCGQMIRTALIQGGIKEPQAYQHQGGLNEIITPFHVLTWIKMCIDLHEAPKNPLYIGNWFKNSN